MDDADTTNASVQPSWRGYGFETTRWSIIAGAASPSSSGNTKALEQLCIAYRPPLLAYVRRLGHSPADAEDLVQAFFGWFIERNPLSAADPREGRFRSFLLGTLKHFLSDARKRRQALKRGGGKEPLSLDELISESGPGEEPASGSTAEDDYDREWGLSLLRRSVVALQAEYASRGKGELFEALNGFRLAGTAGETYAGVCTRLGLTESAVKTAINRLRKRHAELLRAEVARTVSAPAEVDEELRHLIKLLSR